MAVEILGGRYRFLPPIEIRQTDPVEDDDLAMLYEALKGMVRRTPQPTLEPKVTSESRLFLHNPLHDYESV